MGRFKETKSYGGLVTRTVAVQDRSFLNVLFEKKKPVLSSTQTLQADITTESRRLANQVQSHSGIVSRRLALNESEFIPTRNSLFPTISDKPNEFLIQGFSLLINGYILDVRGSRVNGGSLFSQDWNSIELNAPPSSGQRTDLVFLEVWPAVVTSGTPANRPSADEIYPLGNRNWGDAFYDDDLVDTSFSPSRPTDGRIQLQYQFRIVNGVNRNVNTDPMLDSTVKAQGNNGSLTAYSFTRRTAELDSGLYTAGDGSSTARSQLGSVTGYVYAVPIALISRRNSAPFDVSTNPNGSAVSVASASPSDRPDGLFYDEVIEDDIEDLRHSVPTSFLDLEELLEKEVTSIIRRDRNDIRLSLTGSQQSSLILQSDALSVPDLPGIREIAEPDGVRSQFITTGPKQVAVDTVIPNTPDSTGQVRLNIVSGNVFVTVEVDAPNVLGTVQLKWRNDGSNVVLISSSTPNPQQFQCQINTSHGNYQPTGTIDVIYEIEYKDNVQFTYPITEMHDVYAIDGASVERKISFVEEFQEIRSVSRSEVITGYTDRYDEYNFKHANYQNNTSKLAGYSRMEIYHSNGNGTNTYTVPDQIDGKRTLGVFRVRDVTNPSAPIDVNPVSVVRNLSGTYTVIFSSGFLVSRVLEWSIPVEVESTIWSANRRGVIQAAKVNELAFTGNGVDTVVKVQAAGRVLSLPSYRDLLGNRIAYAYIGGQRQAVTYTIFNERNIVITLPFVTTDEVKIPLLVEWMVPTTDKIVYNYSFKTIGGLSELGGFFALDTVFEVVAEGKPFIHSLGSGSSDANESWLQGLASILPLASLESYNYNGQLFRTTINYGEYDRYFLTDLNFRPFDQSSVPLRSGQRFKLSNTGGGTKIQGYSGYSLVPNDFISSRFDLVRPEFEFQTPITGALQLACPFLVRQQHTDELFILLITLEITSTSQSRKFSPVASDAPVAFELFTTKERWLVRS